MNRRMVIAMGSNLGDRLDYLQGGLDGLFDTPRIRFLAVSPVYQTAPVGGPDQQADYLNAVVIAETTMPAQAVLERCHSLEAAFGRVRGELWGPRTLDLDLIIYGDEVSNEPRTDPAASARARARVRSRPLARRRPRGAAPRLGHGGGFAGCHRHRGGRPAGGRRAAPAGMSAALAGLAVRPR